MRSILIPLEGFSHSKKVAKCNVPLIQKRLNAHVVLKRAFAVGDPQLMDTDLIERRQKVRPLKVIVNLVSFNIWVTRMHFYINLNAANHNTLKTQVKISAGNVILTGELVLPEGAKGIVLFVHGSGSSRHSARNLYVASALQSAGLGTLLFDLLTEDEEVIDRHTAHLRFDIGLLAERLIHVTHWVETNPSTKNLKIGYFGASTGAAAALVAAAILGNQIFTVVSRGGRPDLAEEALSEVKCPILLIVGSFDNAVIDLNKQAAALMTCEKCIKIVYGASHLFEEPGTLEEVAKNSAEWFTKKLERSE